MNIRKPKEFGLRSERCHAEQSGKHDEQNESTFAKDHGFLSGQTADNRARGELWIYREGLAQNGDILQRIRDGKGRREENCVTLSLAELIPFTPSDIDEANADGHGGKDKHQNSRAQCLNEAVPALRSLGDAKSAALGRSNRRQGKHG